MTNAYTPQEGSVPARVIEFFAANPDEELTLDDVSSKFGIARGTVHTHLARAVGAGLLARSQASGDWVYRRGGTAPPAAKDTQTQASQRAPLPVFKPTVPDVDPTEIELEEGVPLPRKGRVKKDWTPLLARMQPGHSCVLPAHYRSGVSKAATEAQKAGRGTFRLVKLADKASVRFYRVA